MVSLDSVFIPGSFTLPPLPSFPFLCNKQRRRNCDAAGSLTLPQSDQVYFAIGMVSCFNLRRTLCRFLMQKKCCWVCFSFFLGTAVSAADVFVFTAIPDQDEARLRQRFDKVADYLTQNLGVETRYIPVKSYAAAVTALRNDQDQLASFRG